MLMTASLLALALLADEPSPPRLVSDRLALAQAQIRILILQADLRKAEDALKTEGDKYKQLEAAFVKDSGKDPAACAVDAKQEVQCQSPKP